MPTTTKTRTAKTAAPKAPQDHLEPRPKVLRRIPISMRKVDLFTAVGEDEQGNEGERTVVIKLPRAGLALASRAIGLIDQVGNLEGAAGATPDPKVLIDAYAAMRAFIKGVLVGTDAETEEIIDALDEESLVWALEQIITHAVGAATEALPNS